jgi:dihydrofolate reductase
MGGPAQPDAEVRRLTDAAGPLDWNATLVEGDVARGVAGLKEDLDADLLLIGCGELARHLLAQDLVDELRFWVHPAVWGSGERPFQGDERVRLQLVGSETYDSGVALLRYASAGRA